MLGFAPIGSAPIGSAGATASGGPISVTITDGFTLSLSGLTSQKLQALLTSSATLTDSSSMAGLVEVSVSDAVGIGSLAEYLGEAVVATIDDVLRIAQTEVVDRGYLKSISDAFAVSASVEPLLALLIIDRLRVQDPTTINWLARVTANDAVALTSALQMQLPVTLFDSVGVSADQLVQTVVRLSERLQVASQLAGEGRYNLTVMQAVRLQDTLSRFFGVDMAEGVAFADTIVREGRTLAEVADMLGMSVAIAPQFILAATIQDGIQIDDDQIINAIFAPELLEGVRIDGGHVAPDGTLTAWAMNTRNAAVTEYQNYDFNSFARIENKYLGASVNGLYELLGDDDDGLDIATRIRSGYMQFGGTQLSRLKEAYIAARGGGQMLLRIIDGDGTEYLYSCDTKNMRSSKVPMGKGQRSRYFAFELTTAAQDFDLDTIEFVPLVVQRRV